MYGPAYHPCNIDVVRYKDTPKKIKAALTQVSLRNPKYLLAALPTDTTGAYGLEVISMLSESDGSISVSALQRRGNIAPSVFGMC